MDRVEEYKGIIRRIISDYARWKPSYGEVIVEAICTDEAGHYELIYSGWHEHRRIHGTVIHIDVRDGKVWVQHDGTEDGVTDELTRAGIPREEIVVGFLSPEERKLTPYAALREA
ncbi:MAG: XisI protein [Armatimonadetes bacterium]|nr:XisI protein [Armatimonadota bacterium]